MRSIVLASALLMFPPALAAQNGALVVRGLSFEGNRAIDDETLASFIATTNSSWAARFPLTRSFGLGEERSFSEPEFRADVLRLALVYKLSGYFEVQVDTVVARSPESVDLTFRITEGPPTRLTSLTVEGMDDVPDRERLLRDLPLAEGDVFSRFALDNAVDTLARRLRNHGYPTATVDRQGRADSVTRTARMTILVSPGRRAVFGDVTVRGHDEVDSAFIASLVSAREGRRYRLDALYRSQRALYGTGLFRYATVTIDSLRFAVGDSVVPVAVEITEGRSHRVRGSVGYGTNDCFRVGAGWTARNFLGNGRVVDVSGRVSKIGVGEPLGFGAENSVCSPLADDSVGSRQANYGLELSLRRHAFLSPDNTLALTLFSERRSEYKVYVREDVGAEVSIRRETVQQIPVTLSYRISYGQTRANAVSFCQFFNACVAADVAQLRERRVLTTLTASVTRDRTNAPLNPSRGSVVSLEAAVSSRFLGSSSLQQFVRLVGDAALYHPLTRSTVLAGHVRGGVILAPEIDLTSGRTSFIPPDQRFYAGGPNDVRGYDRNELGPVVYVVPRDSVRADSTYPAGALQVAATGGDRVAIANLELRFPAPFLGERFRLAASWTDSAQCPDSCLTRRALG